MFQGLGKMGRKKDNWKKYLTVFCIVTIFTSSAYVLMRNAYFQGYEAAIFVNSERQIRNHTGWVHPKAPVQSYLEMPFIVLGKKIDVLRNTDNSKDYQPLVTSIAKLYNPIMAGIAVGLFSLVLMLLGLGIRKVLLISAALAFGTMLMPYTSIGMEVTAVTFLVAAIVSFLFLRKWRKPYLWSIIGGLALGIHAVSKAYLIAILPAFVIWGLLILWDKRKTISYKYLINAGGLLVIFTILPIVARMILNNYQNGNLFAGIYNLNAEFVEFNPLEGFYGLLFSSGKSIFLYSPILILAVISFRRFYRQYRNLAIFTLIYSGLLISMTATTFYWSDETWGVRYLVPLMIVGLLPLISFKLNSKGWWKKVQIIVVAAIISLSIFVQVLGNQIPYNVTSRVYRELYEQTNIPTHSSSFMQYLPQFSSLRLHWDIFANRLFNQTDPFRVSFIFTGPMKRGFDHDALVFYEYEYPITVTVAPLWWQQALFTKGEKFAIVTILLGLLGSSGLYILRLYRKKQY